MKQRILLQLIGAGGLGLLLVAWLVGGLPALAQGPLDTTITYQGRLRLNGGRYVSDRCDFQFELYDAATGGSRVGGPLAVSDVPVTDGYFTVELDFGSVFDGSDRYLAIAVRCPTGSGGYDGLLGRVQLDSHPYALTTQASAQGETTWTDVTNKPAGFADDIDNVVTYTNGSGLVLSAGNEFSVITETIANPDNLQLRVGGACSGQQTIQAVNADGSVSCITARIPYTAGEGIQRILSGTVYALRYDPFVAQGRVQFTCGLTEAMREILPDGGVTCEPVPQGDVTQLITNEGLEGGSSSGVMTVSVAAGGIEMSKLYTGAVTYAKIADGAVTADKIQPNAISNTDKILNSTLLLADFDPDECDDTNNMLVYSSTLAAWTCSPEASGDLTGGEGIDVSGTLLSVDFLADRGLVATGGSLQADYDGSGSATTAARSDHLHDDEYVQPSETYSGDISGSFDTGFSVDGLRGIPVAGSYSNNQVLRFDGTNWSLISYGYPLDIVVTEYGHSASQDVGQVYVTCGDTANEVLVGGGCRCNGNDNLEDSYPTGSHTWFCNCSNSNETNSAYVRCMQVTYGE